MMRNQGMSLQDLITFSQMMGTDRKKYSEMLKELLGDILCQTKTITNSEGKEIEIEVTADDIIRSFIEFSAHGKEIKNLRMPFMRRLTRIMRAIQDFESRPNSANDAEFLKRKFRSLILEVLPQVAPFIPDTGMNIEHLAKIQASREKQSPSNQFKQMFPD